MTTPTPALRSAIERAIKEVSNFDRDSVSANYTDLTNELVQAVESVLAPAPVEQAALAAAKEIDYTTPWETPRAEHWARIITRHFQSLATEKPTSSPGETGGEATPHTCLQSSAPGATCHHDFCKPTPLPAQSKTPMTPYLSNTEHREHGITLNGEDYIKLTFARTLETALAAANAKIKELSK